MIYGWGSVFYRMSPSPSMDHSIQSLRADFFNAVYFRQGLANVYSWDNKGLDRQWLTEG